MPTSLEPRVTTSEVLFGDVCQSVDPDPETPYPIYTFGGRMEFVKPYASPAAPIEGNDVVEQSGTNFIVTQGNVRVGI